MKPQYLHGMILQYAATGVVSSDQIRRHIGARLVIDPTDIKNEISWAMVELQNSNRARKGDGLGPLQKTPVGYCLRH